MRPPLPVATYRLQLTPSFGFDRALDQLPRLEALGVSHVYLSPIAEALPGSTHGYDVVDHATARAELGGADGLTRLLDACVDRGMGVLVDHVPNHTAIARPELNSRWWAMLRDGPASDAARWFDVDWAAAGGKVILPVLEEPLSELVERFEVVDGELRLGTRRWPLATGTEALAPDHSIERQHYRLQHWRDPARNVRRFFAVDALAAVRVEDPAVAAVVDTLPRLLADHPGFAGVRIDHIDGLADPLGYLEGLRAGIGDRWIVVEKILAADETLPAAWPVEGTTGYEHAARLEHAMLDHGGWTRLRDAWVAVTGDGRRFRGWELEAREEVLAGPLRPDLDRAARAAAADLAVEAHGDDVRQAVAGLTAHLPRYRTYLPDPEGRPALAAAVAAAAAADPADAPTIERLAAALDEPGEWRTRWQQLTGPAAAKGVEDRAFWRYAPLTSLAEVGGWPEADTDEVTDPVAALHAHHARTQERWPATLLAGTTHDTKRGEDVRAIGLALSARPEQWSELLDAWLGGPGAAIPVDAATHWSALQTALMVPGIDVDRLTAALVKGGREAALHTSWSQPDESFEACLAMLAAALLGWAPAFGLAAELERAGEAASIGLLAARLTAPGIPDVYQGTEAFRYLLVDPDNRVEPDHVALDDLVRHAASVDGAAAWAEQGGPASRAVAISRLLPLRRQLELAGYEALAAPEQLIAFARTDQAGEAVLVTIVPRAVDRPSGMAVELPPGRWRHVLVDALPAAERSLDIDGALAAFPAIVLRRSA